MLNNLRQYCTNEQMLLILTSQLTISADEVKQIKTLISDVDWFEFFKLTLLHKTTTLCWHNIKMYEPYIEIPTYLSAFLRFTKEGVKHKNEILFKELKIITTLLNKNRISFMPVKGAMLIPMLYKNVSIRYMGDLDILIKKEDIKHIESIMTELGYVQGRFDRVSNTVVAPSRWETIEWKIAMSNLFPYVKLNNDNETVVKVDFRYSLDDSLDPVAVNTILSQVSANRYNPGYTLVHLCTHFYDEAQHEKTQRLAKSYNLIKLCDLREFILFHGDKINFSKVLSFGKEQNLLKQLYYTFYFLAAVYSEDTFRAILERMELDDEALQEMYEKGLSDSKDVFFTNVYEKLFG